MTALVVGGGIFGLSIAKALADHGLHVTIVDQGPVPNPLSSSFDHHRLIRYVYGDQKGYGNLVPSAFAAWQGLFEELSEDLYLNTGCLSLGRTGTGWLEASVNSLDDLRLEYDVLSRKQAETRYPWLRFRMDDDVLYTPEGGILRADRIMTALVRHLTSIGCNIVEKREIEMFDPANCRVRSRDGHLFEADILITALGAWHPDFFGGPVRASRQTFARSHCPPVFMTLKDGCPMVIDLEAGGGFYFIPGDDAFPAKYGNHLSRHFATPSNSRNVTMSESEALETVSKERFRTGCAPEVSEHGVCYYSMAPNDMVRFEYAGKFYSLSGGSGHSFKWGPLFGSLVADAVCGVRKPGSVSEIIAGRLSL